ncbi:hypothetical protein [Trueperella pyogenes]|uniref:hypothetical protein n=1 Tax=Trueperella pyogenes TaxID=1661 RepID=UPI00345D82D0
MRREFQTAERLEWVESPDKTLRFRRPNGWEVLTNFGTEPIVLDEADAARVVLRSEPASPEVREAMAGESTVWLKPTN